MAARNSLFPEYLSDDEYEHYENDAETVKKLVSKRLIKLSRQVDRLPHDSNFTRLPGDKRNIDDLISFYEHEDEPEDGTTQTELNEFDGRYFPNWARPVDLEEVDDEERERNKVNIPDLINGKKKKSASTQKNCYLYDRINGTVMYSRTAAQLGTPGVNSNKENLFPNKNQNNNLSKASERKAHSGVSNTHKTRSKSRLEKSQLFAKREILNECELDRSIKSSNQVSSKFSNNKKVLLRELRQLPSPSYSRTKFLDDLMANSTNDNQNNHKEFYKIHYMGLLEKYNQAKRAYNTVVPRLQMLEIQNNILLEIIGNVCPEQENVTSSLKEFVELKAFSIHSLMKIKNELGHNYYNILELLINSKSTSEIRPWAKMLAGMFNFCEMKVDETLIQNLNTMYSISKMGQGN